jgi:hypothetical protein
MIDEAVPKAEVLEQPQITEKLSVPGLKSGKEF